MTTTSPETALAKRGRSLGAVTLLFATFSAIFAIYALHSALPANAIDLPFERAARVRDWFPEGWAFFTAPAQREVSLPFRRVGGEWVSANAGPNASAKNAFGLTRAARVQGLELQVLVEQAVPDDWKQCDEANASCFDTAPVRQVINRMHKPTLCGEVVISEQKPVPWAWSKLKKPFSMPAKVLRMEIKC
jgi:antimicrobial peptide system SdpA family protein